MAALGFPRSRGAGDVKMAATRLGINTDHLGAQRSVLPISVARTTPANPSAVGTIAEAVLLAALIAVGKSVLLPFGVARYDLAIDENGQLVRVQCKTATVRDGCLVFPSASVQRGGGRAHYDGTADIFGVYAPTTGKVYLVPVADVGRSEGRLRLNPVRSGQACGIRWASDYELQ